MATMTPEELAELRRDLAAKLQEVTYTKPVINAVNQAIEDAFEDWKPTLVATINAATAPFGFTFPNQVKAEIVKHWFAQRINKRGT